MLIAVVRAPVDGEARAAAARATGLALADVNRRLAGVLPRVLTATVDPGQAEAIASALERAGFAPLVFDPALAPGDDQRLLPRQLQLEPGGFSAIDDRGVAHACPAAAIGLCQRGIRSSRTSVKVKTSERRLDVGRAVLSGGLLLTRKVEKTEVKTTGGDEGFVLVQRSDGAPDVMLYERRLDYRFLGAEMRPASHGNLELLWRRLQQLAPPGATDDRVSRPGFVSGLPATAADPLDLALHLVALARTREPGASAAGT
jgi:hypothetical protein